MAFLGCLTGAREFEVVARLGPTYFGIATAELDGDLRMYADSERRVEIQPGYLDPLGCPYPIPSGPDARCVKFYLFERGYAIGRDIGQVLTKTEHA